MPPWHEPPRPGAALSPQKQEEQQISQDEQIARALAARGSGSGGGRSHGHGGGSRDPREEQLRLALAANPEGFVSVPMLYVNCSLNDVPVKAFVDTGAQMTVISAPCAKRCNLRHLVDPRFGGVAKGVGVARLAGRVHLATLRFGKTAAVDVALTVMEQSGGPELLLGLDVLRKYRATIDLGKDALLIGGETIPFVDGKR